MAPVYLIFGGYDNIGIRSVVYLTGGPPLAYVFLLIRVVRYVV